jgi:hypothetical protein
VDESSGACLLQRRLLDELTADDMQAGDLPWHEWSATGVHTFRMTEGSLR